MNIKRNIYLMYGISLLQGMVFYGPIATLYRQAAGVSVFEITLIESISLALCIALEMPWGVVADRIGYKNTLVISSLICGVKGGILEGRRVRRFFAGTGHVKRCDGRNVGL